MELNIITFTYLFLRLAPFVLVCFFSLASLFNQDFKGLVYLVGLLFACFGTIMAGNVMTFIPPIIGEPPEICNMITIGQQSNFSKLPIGQMVFGYTFSYLLWSIVGNNYALQNIPTLVFFPLLIICDIAWNIQNTCYTLWQLLASLIMGSLFGLLWAYLISLTKTTTLQYFSGTAENEVCSSPSKQTFKCNVYKNGQLVGNNMGTTTK